MQIKRIALGGIIMTVIMFTPTYACVGTSDGIASYRSMENYISQIQQNGQNTKIEVCKGAAFAHEMQIQFDSKGKDHLETSEELITEGIGQINTDINK